VDRDGVSYLGALITHGGTVQFGPAPSSPESASVLIVPKGMASDLFVLCFSFVILVLAARRITAKT